MRHRWNGDVTATFGQAILTDTDGMTVSDKRRRFPPQIIAHAVWLYFRFSLSLRLLEDQPAPCGRNAARTRDRRPLRNHPAMGDEIRPGRRCHVNVNWSRKDALSQISGGEGRRLPARMRCGWMAMAD
jgi:hypothetical protein